MKINSHNEWDCLREIIVGNAHGTACTLEWHQKHLPDKEKLNEAKKLAQEASPKWFVDEINEDLNELATSLSNLGVKVFRPTNYDFNFLYSSPYWHSTGNNLYNVRDLNLVVGNKVLESPSHNISRYYESTALYDIWYQYFDEGFEWICGPRPILKENPTEPYYREQSNRKLTDEDLMHQKLTKGRLELLHKLKNNEILFEAANTVRVGKDLVYLVSSSGNEKGGKWLQSVLGSKYRVELTDKLYRASHLDSTVLCLRPGLVLLNSKRVSKDDVPKVFKKWDKIWFEDVAPTTNNELKFQKEIRDPIAKRLKEIGFHTNLGEMSSPWVGMNILSKDPQTVLMDIRQEKLRILLEKRGFDVIPVTLRHMYTQGGGIHCATLDTVRDGDLEDYS